MSFEKGKRNELSKIRELPSGFWYLLFIFIFFLVMSVWMIDTSIANNIEYYKYKDVAVSVDAVVSHISVRNDPEGDEYTVFVTYKYEGKEYRDIRAETSSGTVKKGEKRKIKIIPSDPSHIFREDNGAMTLLFSTVSFCLAFFVILKFILYLFKGKKVSRISAMTLFERTNPNKVLLHCMKISITMSVLWSVFLVLFFQDKQADDIKWISITIFSCTGILALWCIINALRYNAKKFSIVEDRCEGKYSTYSLDNSTEYVVFSRGKIIDSDLYDSACEGEVYYLLLNKRNKMIAAYPYISKADIRLFFDSDIRIYKEKLFKDIVFAIFHALIMAVAYLAILSIIYFMHIN